MSVEDYERSTEYECAQKQAELQGQEHPDQAWILSDLDVWFKNPHYKGPKVPHPESVDYDEVPTEQGDEPQDCPGCTDSSCQFCANRNLSSPEDDDVPF